MSVAPKKHVVKKQDRLFELLECFVQNKIEKDAFDEMFTLLSNIERSQLDEYLQVLLEKEDNAEVLNFIDGRIECLHTQVLNTLPINKVTPSKSTSKYFYWAAAASIILFSIVYTPKLINKLSDSSMVEVSHTTDALPGTNKASIHLDGVEYSLDGKKDGLFQNATGFQYLDGTPISIAAKEIKTFKISTPRGGKYQMILPDGTQVWINADTEITYSSSFDISDRTVHLVGEAYFDVAKNDKLPFIVKSKNQESIVTGTTFNINAYLDEPLTKTTLLEGSLRIKALDKEVDLKPNEQIILDQSKDKITKHNIDAQLYTSWKDGVFDLHGVPLEVCMRTISRWYNLDIRYEDEIPDIILGGKMSSGVKLSTFLNFLQRNFEISTELNDNKTLLIKKH